MHGRKIITAETDISIIKDCTFILITMTGVAKVYIFL